MNELVTYLSLERVEKMKSEAKALEPRNDTLRVIFENPDQAKSILTRIVLGGSIANEDEIQYLKRTGAIYNCLPAAARTIAAERPLGPEPMIVAVGTIFGLTYY